ncbi:class I mannose-6-phosphate isomerase [Proteiniphilum sp. X52]|uniref:class I mannose-6-phosphate isomerase n=1 Tax=Proteiniphilum sp. X52 TaxID=2382159 RepID=UPI00351AA55F
MQENKSQYDKYPATSIKNGTLIKGWKNILNQITPETGTHIIAIECYTGVYYEQLISYFKNIPHTLFVDTTRLFKAEVEILRITENFMKEDVLFGYLSNLSIHDYFDKKKISSVNQEIKSAQKNGNIILFGYGSSSIAQADILVYADMPRWEIQQRMRKNEVTGLGVDNKNEVFSLQYKRGYFNDWRVLDKHKKTLYQQADYWLDSAGKEPKLIDQQTFLAGIEKTAHKPFRVVPFFDPAPWGGQWMKEVCGLDKSVTNFGWCFDCVPEENSLLLEIDGETFEMPSVNLVYLKSKELLGEPVEARFGQDFPIRFDLLDTMDGGNLSLQVHPTTQFARDNFGLPYTQDESYYMIEAKEDAFVYVGVKTGIDGQAMINDLRNANSDSNVSFNDEKYIHRIPAKKHDHFLIPAGTIHCSGKNSVALEISATPNLFTFKLWDWDRLGLDGKPRPINIERGKQVIQWNRDADYVTSQLVNQFKEVDRGVGWIEEKTGLHPTEFIETRRHTFTKPVRHMTNNSVNVLNLVEGDEIIVESPDNNFEPLIVHYAETFIIPASVEEYTIRPHGKSAGRKCVTIKASVRF